MKLTFSAQGKSLEYGQKDGNNDHGDDMHGIVSEPTKLNIDDNNHKEALTIGTSLGGIHNNKTHATISSKVVKKAQSHSLRH
ncbi:unnamed protein product [Eruca vesicaria subsp. sativa]|uniref:Uncharacterized protein n=1 Tax=Eruca vesicaria subsp. sativa TaxID=29727 RepID=A0ABC8LMC0_ERUVS|nr:unnamed protein product [Eruca vesicaria subsp. sativa]